MLKKTRQVLLVAVLGGVFALPAQALTQDITAVFTPDPANPLKNEFINTTPPSGMCPWHMPARCEQLKIFSIRVDGFLAHTQRPISPNPRDPRQGAMWKVPSEWRSLQVTHKRTGEVATVQMRIAALGHATSTRPGTHAWAIPGSTWQS